MNIRGAIMSLLALAVIGTLTPQKAQGAGEIIAPILARIELSNVEPALDQAAQIVFYAGTANLKYPPPPPGIRWYGVPDSPSPLQRFERFTACGYQTPPQGIVITPDGKSIISAPTVNEPLKDSKCWDYRFQAYYGMQLGAYTLRLDDEEGNLIYAWEIIYPSGVTTTKVAVNPANPEVVVPLLVGFKPNQVLQLNFYATAAPFAPNSQGFPMTFVAGRSIQADPNGALALDVVIARSSPFRTQNLMYVIAGLDPTDLRFAFTNLASDFFETRRIIRYSVDVRSLLPPTPQSPVVQSCPNSPPTRLQVGMQARVTPGDPNALRPGPGEGADIGIIRAGEQFTIVDGPQCDAKLGLTWWKVTFNGTIGWTAEGQNGVYWLEPLP